MTFFSTKNRTKKIIPLLLLFIFVFFPLHNALGVGGDGDGTGHLNHEGPSATEMVKSSVGGWIGGIASWVIEEVAYGIVYILGLVVALIFALGGSLLSFLLELNSMILNLEVVHKGWQITRDIVNLGFVLAILFISFATIIRYESYGMRSLLPKLIITAILINFSLVISGVILDFAGIITEFFVKSSTVAIVTPEGISAGLSHWNQFALKLADITQVQFLSTSPDSVAAGAAALGGSVLNSVLSLIFSVAFGAVAAVVFLGLAGMFLWRFVKLSYLLILSPLTWFAGIFPAFSKYNKQWWSDFLSATFYAPASTFFLYLAILSMEPSSDKNLKSISDINNFADSISNSGNSLANNVNSANASISFSGVFGSYLSNIGTMVMVMGFLVGSILVASKTGSAGATLAMGTVNKMKGWATGKVKSYAARAGRATVRGTAGRLAPKEETMKKWAEEGGIFKKLAAKGGMRFSKAVSAEKSTKVHEAFASKINDDQLQFEYNTAIDGSKKAAIVKEAIKRGKAGKLSLKDSDTANYKTYGGDMKKFEASYPWLADEINEAKTKKDATADSVGEAAFAKYASMSSDDLGKLKLDKNVEEFSNIKVEGKALDFHKMVINHGDGAFASDLLRNKNLKDRRKFVNNLVIAVLGKDAVEKFIKADNKKTLETDDEKIPGDITKFSLEYEDLLKNKKIKESLRKNKDIDQSLKDYLLNVNAARRKTRETEGKEEKKETKESSPPLPKSGTEIPGTGEVV